MAYVRKSTNIKSEHVEAEPFQTADEVIELAAQRGIITEPLNISELVKALGILVHFEPMDVEYSGSLTYDKKDAKWKMKVNSLHHPNRQRFTMAHEIGHYIKHRGLVTEFKDKAFFRNEESNPMEQEANKFAAELLMPEFSFRKAVDENSQIDVLASRFQVSTMAIRVRAKQLGYKGHNL